MATTIQPPEIKSPYAPVRPITDDGGWGGSPPYTGKLHSVDDSSPASRTGVWVGLAAITMTFAAFTSAMVIRQGASNDWQHFNLPWLLAVNTLVLLASSVVLEIARKRFAAFHRALQAHRSVPLAWLYTVLGLGLLFLAGQYAAWLQLRAQGLYLATNPSSSFFYLFTGLHALHILGGLAGLTLLIWRLSKPVPTLRLSTVSTVSYYWHFMDVLWIYLLLLLWMRV
jgi:cytochrome c oxidase subunit III